MIDYHAIFNQLPGCYLILRPVMPDFVIVDANNAYLQVTQQSPNIIGKLMFEAFPDNPDDPNASGVRNLRQSLIQVMMSGMPHSMNIQRYDTWNENTTAFDIRYWKPYNAPVYDEEGNLEYIIHSVQDVTDLVLLRKDIKRQDEKSQKQLSDAVLTTQELERMEISLELHDNISQVLNTSRLYIETALNKQPADVKMIEAGRQLVSHAIKEVKALSNALIQPSESEKDLVNTLEELLHHVMELKQINVVKTIQLPDEVMIESKVKTNIIRIIQEQLSNVIKHSAAENLYFNLQFNNNKLELTVKDDGRGFDMKENKVGMGLRSIKTRVALINGDVLINSSPGDGCKIHVQIPIL